MEKRWRSTRNSRLSCRLSGREASEPVGCCQEADSRINPAHSGKAYIVFATLVDTERFLSIAADHFEEELESLYNRIVFNGSHMTFEDGWPQRRRFLVEAIAADLVRSEDWDIDGSEVVTYPGPPDINLTMIVHFPREDIAGLERRFANRPVA
jgi:hypothetical protein